MTPFNCAKCAMPPVVERRSAAWIEKHPLANCVTISCACGMEAQWEGRDADRLIEEWNEAQRVARGGTGEFNDAG